MTRDDYPSDGEHEDELWAFAPTSVSLHFTRVSFPERPVTLELVTGLLEDPDIRHGAANLRQIRPAAVAYACTCVSFARGPGGDRVARLHPGRRRVERGG